MSEQSKKELEFNPESFEKEPEFNPESFEKELEFNPESFKKEPEFNPESFEKEPEFNPESFENVSNLLQKQDDIDGMSRVDVNALLEERDSGISLNTKDSGKVILDLPDDSLLQEDYELTIENRLLKRELRKYKNRYKNLLEENNRLGELTNENNFLKTQVGILEQRVDKYRQELYTEYSNTANNKLVEHIEALGVKNNNLVERNEALEAKNKGLVEYVIRLEKENRTLSTESKKSLKEKLRLEDKVKELELKYNELLSKNQGLKNDSKSASDDSKEKLQKEVNNNSPKSALVTNTIQK